MFVEHGVPSAQCPLSTGLGLYWYYVVIVRSNVLRNIFWAIWGRDAFPLLESEFVMLHFTRYDALETAVAYSHTGGLLKV